jgi:hypothetical protein
VSQQLLTGAVERNNLVIVCPSSEPDTAELFGIRHGRLFEQQPVQYQPDAMETAPIAEFLIRLQNAAAMPPVVGQEEIDAIVIIGRWLARYGESGQVVHLPETIDTDAVTRVEDTIRQVLARPTVPDEADLDWEE